MQTFSLWFAYLFGFFILGLYFSISLMRIGFFGTPSLSASVLQDLIDASSIDIAFVVTNPDKPIGRSGELSPTPVKMIAMQQGIPIFTPTSVRKNPEFIEELRSFECDYFIVVAYGKIVPQELLDIPKKKCINVHGSILPAYRGASPIQAALLHGELETGVTIMEMSVGMDEGDILKIRTIAIDRDETTETLFEKFAEISGPTLVQTLMELEMGWITPLPQENSQATYCKKIEKEDGRIDWSQSAKILYNKWQAYTPWPGIYTIFEWKRLLLEKIQYEDFPINRGTIGQVIKQDNGNIGVICSTWILTLEQVKLEWKKSQTTRDFTNGNQKFMNYIFYAQ
jgi:methionyl-tRNA formyltransferase